jgi:hypothetical protein
MDPIQDGRSYAKTAGFAQPRSPFKVRPYRMFVTELALATLHATFDPRIAAPSGVIVPSKVQRELDQRRDPAL